MLILCIGILLVFGPKEIICHFFNDFFTIAGLSTWGRKVGRKFDGIKITDPNEKLQYVVNPPSPASLPRGPPSAILSEDGMDTWSQQTANSSMMNNEVKSEVTVKRRVSRVESLRNLFFSSKGQQIDARRRFLLKKRTRSEEKEKVSSSIFTSKEC